MILSIIIILMLIGLGCYLYRINNKISNINLNLTLLNTIPDMIQEIDKLKVLTINDINKLRDKMEDNIDNNRKVNDDLIETTRKSTRLIIDKMSNALVQVQDILGDYLNAAQTQKTVNDIDLY